MDRALGDVISDRQSSRNRNNSGRRNQRGGVRKANIGADLKPQPDRNGNGNYDESQLWVHDKFEDSGAGQGMRIRGGRDGGRRGEQLPPGSAKVKVENIHYELGEEELSDLFRRQGPIVKLDLLYDRAGRSEGTAFVYYEHEEDAHRAIEEFDGANANGQPIALTLVGRGGRRERDERERSPPRGGSRSLFDRVGAVDAPDPRRDPTKRATPPGIDRYVPPERRRQRDSGERGERERERKPAGNRSREPREGGGRGGGGGGGGRAKGTTGNPRPKKTVEELDAEMNDYFGSAEQETPPAGAAPVPAAGAVDDDEDMIL